MAGDSITVSIEHQGQIVYNQRMPFVNTFGVVKKGMPLAYINSLMDLSFALNEGNFADSMKVSSGPDWQVLVRKN